MRLSIPSRIETSSIEIGSSARTTSARRRGRARSRRAAAGRRRACAGTSSRSPRAGQGRPCRSSSCTRCRTWPRGTTLWIRSGRARWCSTCLTGLSERERVLEDHLHLRPVAASRCRRRAARTSLPLERIEPEVGVVQPREDAGDGALAAAALADERSDRALAEREAHVVDGAELLRAAADAAGADREVLVESAATSRAGGAHVRRSMRSSDEVTGDEVAGRDRVEHGPLGRLARVQRCVSRAAVRARGWKRQPLGGSREVGRGAGDTGQRLDRPVSGGNEPISPTVYGCSGLAKSSLRGRRLDDLARVHDCDPVANSMRSERSCVMKSTAKPSSRWSCLDLLEDLALDDDVERGRRLVHDSSSGLERERHRDDHALPHAAGELVRVGAQTAPVDAHELEEVAGLRRARRCLRDPLVRLASCRRTGRRRA